MLERMTRYKQRVTRYKHATKSGFRTSYVRCMDSMVVHISRIARVSRDLGNSIEPLKRCSRKRLAITRTPGKLSIESLLADNPVIGIPSF